MKPTIVTRERRSRKRSEVTPKPLLTVSMFPIRFRLVLENRIEIGG